MLKDRAVFPGSQSWEVYRICSLTAFGEKGWREKPTAGGRAQGAPCPYLLSRLHPPAEGS